MCAAQDEPLSGQTGASSGDEREPQKCQRCGVTCSYDGWGHVHPDTGLGIAACMDAKIADGNRLDGLRAARKVVERQTDLTDLVHFDRPSDFRKGVLTCLVAIDKVITGEQRP